VRAEGGNNHLLLKEGDGSVIRKKGGGRVNLIKGGRDVIGGREEDEKRGKTPSRKGYYCPREKELERGKRRVFYKGLGRAEKGRWGQPFTTAVRGGEKRKIVGWEKKWDCGKAFCLRGRGCRGEGVMLGKKGVWKIISPKYLKAGGGQGGGIEKGGRVFLAEKKRYQGKNLGEKKETFVEGKGRLNEGGCCSPS